MSIIKRFQRIRKEFGLGLFLRTLFMLIGLIAMCLLGLMALSSFLVLIITIIGLLIGFLAKNKIPDGFEYYPKIFSAGLFIYGVILFLGDRIGIGNNWKLVIIAVTTVIIFNLQFWSLSDESIINTEKRG